MTGTPRSSHATLMRKPHCYLGVATRRLPRTFDMRPVGWDVVTLGKHHAYHQTRSLFGCFQQGALGTTTASKMHFRLAECRQTLWYCHAEFDAPVEFGAFPERALAPFCKATPAPKRLQNTYHIPDSFLMSSASRRCQRFYKAFRR